MYKEHNRTIFLYICVLLYINIFTMRYFFTFLTALLCCGTALIAQQSPLWSDVDEAGFQTNTAQRVTIPASYRTLQLDLEGMKSMLADAPQRWATEQGMLFTGLPMPDGSQMDFNVFYDPIMHPDLAAQYPEIRTYVGFGIQDPTAMMRMDVTPKGFHAMVLSGQTGTVFIDPYSMGDTEHYISYFRSEFYKNHSEVMECGVEHDASEIMEHLPAAAERAGDCQLRTYRLALACTGEYAAYHGGTVAGALAAMNTSMNRVNAVYEREFAIRMNIIATNSNIIYLDSGTDPYTNNNGNTMLGQNQTTCDGVIGNANYDIGHVFSTGGGGVAQLWSPCVTGSKARGVTGRGAPIGDAFDIDYVAHEMGHQFGCHHTFSACNGNETTSTAVEPGSGTTIMAYAGICGSTLNVQSNSNDYFSAISLAEAADFVVNGNGATCPVTTSLSNTPPTVSPVSNYVIPRSTPFMLTGSASDVNGDAITYCWEQIDANAKVSAVPVSTDVTGPLFRSYSPTTNNVRIFPQMSTIVNNNTFSTTLNKWEVLPTVGRDLNFRLTIRDNRAGGGCTTETDMLVTVDPTATGFAVTAPNTAVSWSTGSSQTVTWTVGGTDANGVNCANVDIYLSTDGGYTYPVTLASNVPNDGSETISVPNNVTTTARVMVKGRDNIFFDISNANFTIVAGTATYNVTLTNSVQTTCIPNSATYTVNTEAISGFSGNVSFSTSGLPAGATATFVPSSVTAGSSTTLTVNTSGVANAGTYNFTITGMSGAINRTANATLQAYSIPAQASLSIPANNDVVQTLTPTFSWASVLGGTSYTLEVATNSTFTTGLITQSGITGTSYTMGTALSVNSTYYWRLKTLNDCGQSTSAVRQFTIPNPTCNTYTSTNVPVTIPSSGSNTVTSTLGILSTGSVTDVNVTTLSGTHSYVSDLLFKLIGPDNTTSVTLMNGVCGSNDNFNIKFDDEAASSSIACPPTGGLTYRPSSPLSALKGQSLNGTWTMSVTDQFDVDGGTLQAWAIQVCVLNYVPVPVELTSFTAQPVNNQRIDLYWQTATERHNKGFDIQRRRSDERDFTSIGWVNGSGNSTVKINYSFADDKVEKGKTYYYRLRQLDDDGTENYSEIQVAALKTSGLYDVALSPNPASGQTRIVLSGKPVGAVQVRLIGMDGRIMSAFTSPEDVSDITVSLRDIPSGIYSVEVQDEQEIWRQKLMVK